MLRRRRPWHTVVGLAVAAALAWCPLGCSSDEPTADRPGAGSPGASTTSTAATDDRDAADDGTASSGERIALGDDTALVWGDGTYGVVLAHGAVFDAASWEDQAVAIAAQGATVVAVEDIGIDGIEAAVDHLERERGVSGVALVGGSAGADAILRLASEQPDVGDQFVLLSPNRVVEGLGPQPKLFIASEDEPVADVSVELAASAPGDDNAVELLSGSAHAQHIFASEQGPRALEVLLARLAAHAEG